MFAKWISSKIDVAEEEREVVAYRKFHSPKRKSKGAESKMKKVINAMIVRFAKVAAKSAAGAASNWGTYQPKEPKCLRKK